MVSRPRSPSAFVVCATYFALHLLAHYSAGFFEVSPGVSIWYPPYGLALALLALQGLRYAPAVFAANLFTATLGSSSAHWWTVIAYPLLIALNYSAAAWYARRALGGLVLPGKSRATFHFATLIICAPLPLALAGAGILVATGKIPPTSYWHSTLEWWTGDVSGLLTVVPAVMVFAEPWIRGRCAHAWVRYSPHPPDLITLLQGILLVVFMVCVFTIAPLRNYNAYYLCFLPIIWISLRHGLLGAAPATLAITMVGLACIHFTGSSPFLTLNFLLFELTIACAGLGLGSIAARHAEAERNLDQSQAVTRRLLDVLEATPDFVAVTDDELRIRYANTALTARGDGNSAIGLALTDLFPGTSAASILREALTRARASGSWHDELAVADGKGATTPYSLVVLAHALPGGGTCEYSFVLRNIARQKQAETERVENERRMLQVQKLESLGVLAGGIAHDFNNLLTPLMGYTCLAQMDLPPDSPVQESLMKIEEATRHAAALCQQMLAYAGRSPLSFGDVNIAQITEDTSQLLRLSAGKKRTLTFEHSPGLPLVTADPVQLRQVLMNLVLNASEAIGDKQGQIVIRTRPETLAAPRKTPTLHGHAPGPGPYVVAEVQDNGCGMPPEVLARIFEPFYTTKSAGHGLGLAAVLGIVNSHNAAIEVESAPGRGSTFRLFFPALQQSKAGQALTPATGGSWRGSGAVLVVDDEPEVRAVVSRTLEVCGFDARQANDGQEAVEAVRESPDGFRLVLLDLMMPRMDGEQAFHEINRIAPKLPVVIMSGFSEKLSLDRFVNAKPAAFLPKPFDYQMLRERLQHLPALK